MVEEKKKQEAKEQRENKNKETAETLEETKSEESKMEEAKTEKKKEEQKTKEKKTKKKEEEIKVKKEEAIARGVNLHISKKHGVYICSFIKNKKIDGAIKDLESVTKFKRAVPFKGEIPHRKGKNMMSGRYPVKAAGLFINILKALKGNVLVNGLDLDKTKVYYASASWGRRPMRSGRREGKRTNVMLRAKEMGAQAA